MACFEIVDGVGIIPEGTKEIYDYAFAGNLSLESIIIPDSVTTIGSAAFYGCENLNYVTIPSSVISIEDYAFHDCKNLICVYCKTENPPTGGFEMLHFSRDSVNTYPIWCQICVPITQIEAYRVAKYWREYANNIAGYDFETEEFIEENAISPLNNEIWYTNGSTIESTTPYSEHALDATIISNLYYFEKRCWVIKFDRDVTTIGYDAFLNRNKLISVTIPESVTKIGQSAFEGCTLLESISIPNSVTEIHNAVFKNCRSLKKFSIPDSTTYIGEEAFCDCISLERIIIPKGLNEIAARIFENCSKLKSVIIPEGLTLIGEGAFSSCTSLTNITIPNSVISIGDKVFEFCENLIRIEGKFTSDDNRCIILNGILKAFAPANLTNYPIPHGVIEIGEAAFAGCDNLTNIDIPNSVITIGTFAFGSCRNLKNITIPASVTSIKDFSFLGCRNLESVNIDSVNVQIGEDIFNYCDKLSKFSGIYASKDNRCIVIDGTLKYFAPNDVTEYIIPEEVKIIDQFVFCDCETLTSVTIPSSVEEISEGAFFGCENLASVYCYAIIPPFGGDRMLHHHCNGINGYSCSPLDCNIYVPKSVIEQYKTEWSEYRWNIKEL